ncbi:hypothetical protein BDN70DRAFT_902408 [Pholiota conissans]|uniref:Uncharacterized protein n=1 Tax=Pholiota conissans TaxID=109636 RepID=A0A9P5YHN7_9AGAR|nr:hypothetical protein BDN70DRAFT_902408 [Pholiota conissans]
MSEDTYANAVTAKVYFYKQRKDTDKIDIFIKPTTLDPNNPNPLKKVFGGAGMALFESVVNLSAHFRLFHPGLINGTLSYNDAKELKGEYTYSVTSTKDSDNKVFCTIKGHREKNAHDGTVKYYKFKFVASDCFSGDDSVECSITQETLETGFTNSAYWLDDTP